MYTELRIAEVAAASDLANRSLLALASLSLDASTTYRGLLASELSDSAYDLAASACAKTLYACANAGSIRAIKGDEPLDAIFEALPNLVAVLNEAQDALAPVAYPESAAVETTG